MLFLGAFLSIVSLHHHLVFGQLLYVCILSSALLIIFCPIGSPALSKVGDTKTYQNSPTNVTLEAFVLRNTSVPETKFTVKFCIRYICGEVDCYCCMNKTPIRCYFSMADCKVMCPACNPVCPPLPQPQTGTMEGHL